MIANTRAYAMDREGTVFVDVVKARKGTRRTGAIGLLTIGGLLAMVGVGVTVGNYYWAPDGDHLITWGVILAGAVIMVVGGPTCRK